MTTPSRDDVKELKTWFDAHRADFPKTIAGTLGGVLEIYFAFSQSPAKAKQMLARLREAMGISPKSERGRTDNAENENQSRLPEPAQMSPEQRERYGIVEKKREGALREVAKYNRELRGLKPRVKTPEQLEFALADATEMVFSQPASGRKDEESKMAVERMKEFDQKKGLHSAYDSTKRIDLQILVTDIDYKVETVTDPETGKSVRASMDDVGPAGSTMTWRAIANLVKLTVGFAIPINRLSLIIGQPEFSSSQICRVLRMVAEMFLPIYLYLAEALSDSAILSGDDTGTNVLERIFSQHGESLAHRIDDHLGYSWPKADGTGEKKALNVSLLVGRSHRLDPRSTIRFFRTHQGSVGNLLTRLLEWRNPKAGPLTFQGDLSTTNLPSRELRKKFEIILAGCGAHARRPFWRHREEDGQLCYFMLRGFMGLSRVEELIDDKGRTQANVSRLRDRYARKIWEALRNRCLLATEGTAPNARFTMSKDSIAPDVWPPNSELYRACAYVINHFKELTEYLENPFLKYTNNGSERALRIEKCFLSSSKFSKTRSGRATTDILRTINATCTAAGVDLTHYLRFVFKNRSQLQSHPELFTPYALAQQQQEEKTNQHPRA